LGATNARASFTGGAGKYVVFVKADFPYTKSWLKEFVINVYGPPTQLALSKQFPSPMDLFMKDMQGLCEKVMVAGLGEYKLDEKTTMWGMPIFRAAVEDSREAKVVAFMPKLQKTIRKGDMTYYSYGGANTWLLARGDEENQVYAYAPQMLCAQSLLQQDEDDLTDKAWLSFEPELLPESIVEIAESGTDDVDVEGKCGKFVDRFPQLGKASDIASSGKDEYFPESMDSIAEEGANCGDAAANQFEPCSKYNHWQSVAALRKSSGDGGGGEVTVKCEGGCPYCKPHGTDDDNVHNDMPLCANGEFQWACVTGNRGGRVSCPYIAPIMCAKKKCDGDQDYCCEKDCGQPGDELYEKYGGPRLCN